MFIIYKIQKWMDTMAGQTFMQYAYSWGAAIVILGTLFKLTHLEGANIMLFIGMGTEVFVFILSGFERVTAKAEEIPSAEGQQAETPMADSPAVVAVGTTVPVMSGVPVGNLDPDALAHGAALSAAAANLASAGQAAAEAQLALSQLKGGTAGVSPAEIRATDPAAVEEAVENYADELLRLTEALARMRESTERMAADSDEVENLNRTITGIVKVYELQLRSVSRQVNTIDQIDAQTRQMAAQIEELNRVYARMIQALTVNMAMGNANVPVTEK